LDLLGFLSADCSLSVPPGSAAAAAIEMLFQAFTADLRVAMAACLHPFAIRTLLQLALYAFSDLVVVTIELIFSPWVASQLLQVLALGW